MAYDSDVCKMTYVLRNRVEVVYSTNFPERSLLLQHRNPPLVRKDDTFDEDKNCELVYTAIDISGKGKNDDLSGFHPVGLMYGIGDSLAQIQMNHVKTRNKDEEKSERVTVGRPRRSLLLDPLEDGNVTIPETVKKGYEYSFNSSIYSLYSLGVRSAFSTVDNDKFGEKLYSKNDGQDILVLNNAVQARMFHRFYRKSNFVNPICEGDRLGVGETSLNRYFDTEFVSVPHPEMRSEIIIRGTSAADYGTALKESVIIDGKKVNKLSNLFGLLNKDDSEEDIKALGHAENIGTFTEMYGFTPITASVKTVERFVDANFKDVRNVIMGMTDNNLIVGNNMTNSLTLYKPNGVEIPNKLKTGFTLAEAKISVARTDSVNTLDSVHILKNITNGSLVSVTNMKSILHTVTRGWFERTSAYQKVSITGVTDGKLFSMMNNYNDKIDTLNTAINVGSKAVGQSYYDSIKNPNDTPENPYEDIDNILWYRVTRDWGGIEFRISYAEIASGVNAGQLPWMKNVRSYFGVMWDVKDLVTFTPVIAKGSFENVGRIPGYQFIKHCDKCGTGWYNIIQEYTIGRIALDISLSTIKFTRTVFKAPEKLKDYVFENPTRTAAIIAGLASFGIIAYVVGSHFAISITRILIDSFVAMLAVYKLPAGLAISSVVYRMLNKYISKMSTEVKGAILLMQDQIVNTVLEAFGRMPPEPDVRLPINTHTSIEDNNFKGTRFGSGL